MRTRLLLAVATLCSLSVTATTNNKGDAYVEDSSSDAEFNFNQLGDLASMASAFMDGKSGDLGAVGSILGGMMQGDGAKNMGDAVIGALAQNPELLSGLGTILAQNAGGGVGQGGGLDPSMLLNVLGAFAAGQKNTGGGGGGGWSDLLGSMLGGGGDGIMSTVADAYKAFVGDEAHERESAHSGHAWLLPPLVERAHVLWDHFTHTDLYKRMFTKLGIAKLLKTFSDKDGNVDVDRILSLLENHSFRKYWIGAATNYLTDFVGYFADPATQQQYLTTAQYFVNGFLKARGYPKQALFNPENPVETVSLAINIWAKQTFGFKIDSKQYVKPAIIYFKDLVSRAQQRGLLIKTGIDSRKVSQKITDTLNLEIIEPVLRVFRAYRFAKKVPQCDKYVMCVINEENPNDRITLPGLKIGLSKGTSLIASWFLSSHTGSSYFGLYDAIQSANKCHQKYPIPECDGFHAEEIKVTTEEYIHNEL